MPARFWRWKHASTRLGRGFARCSAPYSPEVRIEPDERGGSQLALSFPSARTDKDVSRLAQEVFALPGRIANLRRRRMAIALDEFQAIASFNGGSVEHALRAAVQHQREVGYVFSGSEPSLMERMLGRSRPFYKAGPVMRLQKIPADRFAEFIEARFRATRLRPAAGLGAAIVELAGNLPYDVQRLAHEVWDDARGGRAVGVDDLHETLRRLLGEHDAIFEATWQRLTLAQRAALRGAVLEDGARAVVRGRPLQISPRWRFHRSGVPQRARARGHSCARRLTLRGCRFAAPGMGRAANALNR